MDYIEKVIALLNSQELSKEQKEKLENIFPELKGNENERIKEDLIQWFNDFPDTIWKGHYKKDVIAWLEKQGEKMSAGRVLKIRREAYQSGYNDGYKHGQEDKEKESHEQLIEKQGENKSDFSNIRIWKYIVDAVLTEENGIGQYLDSAHTEKIAKKLQKRFSNFK